MIHVVVGVVDSNTADLNHDDPRFHSTSNFERASVWNELGNQKLRIGERDDAMEAYEKAAEILPSSLDIRKNMLVLWLTSNIDSKQVLNYVREHDLLRMEETATAAPTIPTVASLVGVALYNMNRLNDSVLMFEHVVHRLTPTDHVTWTNLGDTYLHSYQVQKAANAYKRAWSITQNPRHAVSLYRASSWGCDWSKWNDLESSTIAQWETPTINTADTTTYGDFIDVAPKHLTRVNKQHAQRIAIRNSGSLSTSWSSTPPPPPTTTIWSTKSNEANTTEKKVLRIGFISSDFGVHPVSSLIRGLLQELAPTTFNNNNNNIISHVYVLSNEPSWWLTNITNMYNNYDALLESPSFIRLLYGMSHSQRVAVLQNDRLDVLIDLNGWTMHSGLELLTERVALVHATFLGYSMTTGANFVDFYIADSVTAKVEKSKDSFVERLLMTQGSFFANDYVGLQSHVVLTDNSDALIRKGAEKTITTTNVHNVLLPKHETSSDASNGDGDNGNDNGEVITLRALFLQKIPPVIYACFSDFRKMDPTVFDSWMNILRMEPRSLLWMIKHHKLDTAVTRLKAEAAARGISPYRIIVTSKEPWIHHIVTKRVADVVLDTRRSNGHTSNADALWGGVPVLTVEGERMGTRVTSSFLHSLTNEKDSLRGLITRSMKSYEQVASSLASSKHLHREGVGRTASATRSGSRLLRGLRKQLKRKRIERGRLFDTKSYAYMFTNRMKTAVEVKTVSPRTPMHVLPGPMCGAASTYSEAVRRQYSHLSSRCGSDSKDDNNISLQSQMPEDPFTKNYYEDKINNQDTNIDANIDTNRDANKDTNNNRNNESSTTTTNNQPQLPIILLHAHGEMCGGMPAISAEGWTSIHAGDLSTHSNDSITAVHLTFGNGEICATENLDQMKRLSEVIQESWRVLLHGGALFVALPDNGAYDARRVHTLLSVTRFCVVEPMAMFGTFDIQYNKLNGRKLQRWSGHACGKAGPKIHVGVE